MLLFKIPVLCNWPIRSYSSGCSQGRWLTQRSLVKLHHCEGPKLHTLASESYMCWKRTTFKPKSAIYKVKWLFRLLHVDLWSPVYTQSLYSTVGTIRRNPENKRPQTWLPGRKKQQTCSKQRCSNSSQSQPSMTRMTSSSCEMDTE